MKSAASARSVIFRFCPIAISVAFDRLGLFLDEIEFVAVRIG